MTVEFNVMKPLPPIPKSGPNLIHLLLALLVIALGGGLYYYFKGKDHDSLANRMTRE